MKVNSSLIYIGIFISGIVSASCSIERAEEATDNPCEFGADGSYMCFNNLSMVMQCRNSEYILIESCKNDTQCSANFKCEQTTCTEDDIKCINHQVYICRNNRWILNAEAAGTELCPGRTAMCSHGQTYCSDLCTESEIGSERNICLNNFSHENSSRKISILKKEKCARVDDITAAYIYTEDAAVVCAGKCDAEKNKCEDDMLSTPSYISCSALGIENPEILHKCDDPDMDIICSRPEDSSVTFSCMKKCTPKELGQNEQICSDDIQSKDGRTISVSQKLVCSELNDNTYVYLPVDRFICDNKCNIDKTKCEENLPVIGSQCNSETYKELCINNSNALKCINGRTVLMSCHDKNCRANPNHPLEVICKENIDAPCENPVISGGSPGDCCNPDTYQQTCNNNHAMVCADDKVKIWNCDGGCQINPAMPYQVICKG